ncbi:Manganese transport system membrane protein MntB [Rubrobacter xylanophilus DSM 9941]|uniref:metal ABC transporter permease n=1 Tax=Rubrobacter xylanophilus TaxID=49319 RepID=UPI001C63D154|nr:metal ABC transporter permease [Rubrobacter xylanophilus]QYJ14384.1 Manganese transport system membrane protein MntB [Rubrobacter xylanophilus DSM 9941]
MIEYLLEPLGYGFMQRGLIASVLVAVVCGALGSFVVLKGLAFIGDALAHASFGGVALAFVLGLNVYAGALVFALATALGIGALSRHGRVRSDTAIGVLFSGTFALGIVIISGVESYTTDLFGYLFGDVLSITVRDLLAISLAGVAVLVLLALFYRQLLFVAFDPAVAAASGVPARALEYLLLALLGLTIVAALQAVGIVLVVALLVTPSATAHLFCRRFHHMILASMGLGSLSALLGIYLSYYLNVASGASIILVATAIFFAVLGFRRARSWRSGFLRGYHFG